MLGRRGNVAMGGLELAWRLAQTNGEWERAHGVTIETLDTASVKALARRIVHGLIVDRECCQCESNSNCCTHE